MKTTYRAFSQDAVIDSIRQWVCILFVAVVSSLVLSSSLLFHLLQIKYLLLFLTSVLFPPSPLPLSKWPAVRIWQADAHHANAPFFKSLRPLSPAKQIHRNSAHFFTQLTFFSISALFRVNIQYINLSGRLISFTLRNVQLYTTCHCTVFLNDGADLELLHANFNQLFAAGHRNYVFICMFVLCLVILVCMRSILFFYSLIIRVPRPFLFNVFFLL